ncbi:MAG: hypothetical protein WC273_03365 [Dehalococcoidia bacterium]
MRPPWSAPDDAGLDPLRLIIVARRVEDGRYLFARWSDWPHPTMISTLAPSAEEGFVPGIQSLLHGRMRVRVAGTPHLAADRLPMRMPHPRGGGPMLGWLQPVAVAVSGDPAADALIEEVVSLTLEEALAALATDVERAALRAGAAAFAAAASSGESLPAASAECA